VRILRHVLESIATHAKRSHPNECCGILLTERAEPTFVNRALPARNAAKDPTVRYELDPQDHLHAVNLESTTGVQIAGYYHSHPSGEGRPSQHDLDQAVPGALYLIIGLGGDSPEVAAWRLAGNRFASEALQVREE
jgi:proteasome lid subunit RPN8/RPN11